jgi:endo-1,4-beta-xylanase
MWRPEAALIRKNWTPRPAWQTWLRLQKEWSTNVAGRTGREGIFTARAFYGTYEITVRQGSKTITKRLPHRKGDSATVIAIA